MKKIKIKFSKNRLKKYAGYLVKHRRLFFVMFFGALFIFTFDVIYENAYYNMKHIDYERLRNFKDDETKKNIMFEKIIENINLRKQMIQDIKNKEYKNIFSFNNQESLNENNGDSGNNNVSVVLPAEPPILPTH